MRFAPQAALKAILPRFVSVATRRASQERRCVGTGASIRDLRSESPPRKRGLRIPRGCVLASLLLFCATLPCGAQDEFATLIRTASGEAAQSNYSAAMADVQAAIALVPGNPEGWYQLGLLRGQMGDFAGAESAFGQALRLQPEFPEAHYNLGLTLIADPQRKLDWPAAIAEFRAALKYRPDYADALNLLGAGLTSTGDIGGAIVELRRATQLRPALAEAHFNLAIALEENDSLEEAAMEYQAAVAAKGAYPEAAAALGKLLFRMGKTAQAEEELIKAVTLNPDLGDAHYVLARVLQALQKTKDAEVEFAIAESLSQRLPSAMQSSQLSNQALDMAAKGEFRAAADMLHKAIALKPDYGIPHYNLGLILADQGDLPGAAQELAKAISLLPGEAKPWYQLGRVLRRSGDDRNAVLALSWAVRLSPADPAIRAELSSVQAASKQEASAQDPPPSARAPSFGASSDTAAAHISFAEHLIAEGDLPGAEGELLRALVLQPGDLHGRRTLAKAFEGARDRSHAILEYQKILRASQKTWNRGLRWEIFFWLQATPAGPSRSFSARKK